MRVLLMVVALALAPSIQAAAEDLTRVDHVLIRNAWARASQPADHDSAVYMTLETTGDQSDRLVAAATPAAAKAELRTYWLEGCFVHGRPVEAIELAPGAQTVLDPGGLHIMLTELRQDLAEGESIPLTLSFEKAGTLEIEVPVYERDHWRTQGQGASVQAATN